MSLEAAIKLAKGNPVERLPRMAALIYDKRRLVGYGLNSWRTHPIQKKFGRHECAIHMHAEIAALVNARCGVEGMTLYIARVLRDDSVALAKPCPGCEKALIQFGIGDVVWTE